MGSVIVEVTYCWTDGTPDGDLYVSSVGEAFDAGDKATPKAMSVAYRTMLLQTLCLPTGEVEPGRPNVQTQRATCLRGAANVGVTEGNSPSTRG